MLAEALPDTVETDGRTVADIHADVRDSIRQNNLSEAMSSTGQDQSRRPPS